MKPNSETLSITDIWKKSLADAQMTLERFVTLPKIWDDLTTMTQILVKTFENGGTVFSCGNGGSHCDAMHFAEELTGRYRKERKPMGALALGDASHLTCVANDYGFEFVFARQISALGRKGDCLLLLSTSGNSINQVRACQAAREKEMSVVALLGKGGGQLKDMTDLSIVVPADTSDRIQEIHIKIIHTVIESVERVLFPELY